MCFSYLFFVLAYQFYFTHLSSTVFLVLTTFGTVRCFGSRGILRDAILEPVRGRSARSVGGFRWDSKRSTQSLEWLESNAAGRTRDQGSLGWTSLAERPKSPPSEKRRR